jgi:hypothetical protein
VPDVLPLAVVAPELGELVPELDGASGEVLTPSDVEAGSIVEDLRTAAQVIEMLLISDHTRLKHDAVTPYDSTHVQQRRLLPISHPDDWASAPDWFRTGG